MKNSRAIIRHAGLAATAAVTVALCVVAAPASAVNLLALLDTGEIYSSADNGVTWTPLAVNAVSDGVDIYAGDTSSELFMGTESGSVYRSNDGGVNWTGVGSVPAIDVAAMLVRVNGDVLMLTQTGSLYRSADNGATFSGLAALTANDHVSLTEIRIRVPRDLYALTRTGGVSKSSDDGVSWTTVGVITTSDAREIRAVGSDLYVMTGTGDIARSGDSGVTWTFVGTLSQVNMTALTTADTMLVAGSQEGHVASSGNGVSWSWQGSVNQLRMVALGNDTPTTTAVRDRPPAIDALALRSVFPNPSAGTGDALSFVFELPGADRVALEIYDVAGRRVASRSPESFETAGTFTVQWSPGTLSSGVYFARLVGASSGETAPKKLVVIR